MQIFRRSALRAASSPSLFSKSHSIKNSVPFAIRCKSQTPVSALIAQRFFSDDSRSPESSSNEHQSTPSTYDSAAESVSATASEADKFASDPTDAQGEALRRVPRSSMDVRPSPSIYVGNLLFDLKEEDLAKEFSSFGPIKSATLALDARGLSKGFGYIEFESTEQAAAAIKAKNLTIFEGRRLIVNYVSKPMRSGHFNPPSKTLFIGNLAFEMSDTDLNKLFREIRNVIDVRVAIDRRTGHPRGFAHADFVDVDSAVAAYDILQGKEIYGRKLRLDYSSPAAGRRP